jgi:hypothetical protein
LLDDYLLGQWGDIDVESVQDEFREKEIRKVQKRIIKSLDEAREEWLVGCLVGLLVCCELHGEGISFF